MTDKIPAPGEWVVWRDHAGNETKQATCAGRGYGGYPELIEEPKQPSDPKALTAGKKLPLLSVMSPASLIHEAVALQYGAFDAPKIDGAFGYGPYNWRKSEPIEAMTYVEAAERHLLKWVDGEDYDPDTKNRAHHLGLAKASLGILLDAMENGNLIDNRPPMRKQVASRLLAALKR